MKEKYLEILKSRRCDFLRATVEELHALRYQIAEEVWMEWQKDLKTPYTEYWLWMRNKKRCQQEEQ